MVVERLLEVMPTPAHVQWPTDQNELFAGPERLFGLPSRAVAVLTARTGDEPGRRLRELRRWERAGLARWNGSRFVVTHADLDRLVDEERSLRHGLDLLGGAPGADRLLDDAADLADRGRLGPAWARVEQALALLDADGDEPKRALELGACIALFGASPDWLRRLRAALRRAGLPADAPLVRLAASATEVLRRGGEDQLPALAALPPFRHDDLETWRQALRIYAARRVGVLAEQALLDELAPWAREHGGDREARWQGWWGWLHYRQGRYEQAAEHCLAEARGRRAAIGRLAAAVRAGGAWLETSHLDRCARIAREGLERALALHVPIYAAHASQLLRCVAYRSGRADRVDEELLEAAERLGVPSLQGLMLLNEAAVAWRAGLPKAQRLAERALAAFVTGRRRSEAGLARALALAAGSELRPEAVIECEQDLRAGGLPGIELQGLALLERVAPEVARRERLEELVVGFQGDGWYRRRELLAPAECGFGVC